MVHGVDISSYQGSPDLAMMAGQASYVICRHSIGSLRDIQFDRNWAGLDGKTIRGLYYVPHPQASHETAKAQLRDAISRNPDLPIALDIEVAGVYVDRVYALAMYLYQQTGKYPLIYTSPGFWGALWGKANSTHTAFFSKCPLWIAHYTSAQNPMEIEPWKSAGKAWTFWQYGINSNKAVVEAHGLRYWESKAIDVNRYNGELLDLYAWCGVGEIDPPTEPPIIVPTDEYVRVVNCEWLSFRTRPEVYPGDRPAIGRKMSDPAKVIERKDGWLYVELSGGDRGWISEEYTELV